MKLPKLDDTMLIWGLGLFYFSSVMLWGMYGCYPSHYPPWPIKPTGILDNILTDMLFLGISLLIAAIKIQQVEAQRSKSASNALCSALARLAVFADMRIARNDFGPFPSFEDRALFRLYERGGTENASREMSATSDHFYSIVDSENFLEDNDIRTMYLPLIPRVQKYLKDTEGIRRDLRNVLISRAIAAIDDEDIIAHLERFEELHREFDDKINCYASDGNIRGVIAEINNFLIHQEEAYVTLKGGHWLHPIGALYGPEDPPEIRI